MDKELEHIFKKIDGAIKPGEKQFAVFDFDNTCIVNDISEAALHYMTARRLFRDENIFGEKFEHYYKLLDDGEMLKAYEFSSEMIGGFSVDEIKNLAGEVIKSEGDKIAKANFLGREIHKGIKLREKTMELMDYLRDKGVEIWIVSASSETLVLGAMEYFSIKANLIGIRNVLVDGMVTSELSKPLSIMGQKVDCIKKYIHSEQKPIFGIGDSINDLQMLEYCTIKAVINRQNSLAEKAEENSWFLINS